MDVEGVTVKSEDDSTPQWCTQSIVKEEVDSDSEAAEMKLESELILSDHDDEACSPESVAKKSSLNPTGELSRIMVPRKTVKIILKRCDASDASKFSAEQSSTSRIKNEDYSDVQMVSVKLENDFESIKTGETCGADDLIKAAVSGIKQCANHSEANSSVEIKAESLITHELVGNFPRSLESGDIVKHEEREHQTHFDHYSTISYTNAEILNNLEKGTCGLEEGNAYKIAEEKPLDVCSRFNTRVKMEEEEEVKVRITNELVSDLKGELKCEERDEKPLLKIVKSEESEADAGSRIQCNVEHTSVSGAANLEVDKTVPVVFQPKNKVSRKASVKSNSGVKRYSCSECSYRCNGKANMTKHMRVHTGERPYECKECHKKFKLQTHLNGHMITHTNKRLFKCVHCAAAFKTKADLIKHLRRHSDERPYSCTECPAKFKERSHLTAHSIMHSSDRRFECAHCNRKFKSKAILKDHMRTHFDDKSHSCTLCGAKFRQSGHLTSHLRTKHSTERPFECTQCGNGFKSRGALKSHLVIHSSKKSFQCPHCPSAFRHNNTLKSHVVAKHTSKKSYACAHCSMMFELKRYLANHLMTHSNERPHSCPQCPMAFKCKSSLKSHLRSHTGEKPYSCSQCPAKFSQKCNLKAHLAVHSDEQPFACDQCPAKFKRSCNFKEHKKTHVTMTLLSRAGAH